MGASALISSPTLTCHLTISASCRPSPRSGSLKIFMASAEGYRFPGGGDNAGLPWHVLVLEARVGHHDIAGCHALYRREQVEESFLGQARRNFRGEAGRAR